MDNVKKNLKVLDPIASSLKLIQIDQSQSLSFLKKYDIKPSQIIALIIVVFLFGILLFDGTSFIVSITCFLIPGFLCFTQFSKKGGIHSQPINSQGKNNNNENIITSNQSTIFYRKYFTYWAIYFLLQFFSPFFIWIFNDLTYIFIRIMLTMGLLYPKIQLALVFYNIVIAKLIDDQIIIQPENQQQAQNSFQYNQQRMERHQKRKNGDFQNFVKKNQENNVLYLNSNNKKDR